MYLQMRDIILIAHDIRSTHNVGSLLRTAECLGIKTVYLTGYSPYPKRKYGDEARESGQQGVVATTKGAEQPTLDGWDRR